MKKLNYFIQEKLKLNKDYKEISYTCNPDSKEELKEIIEKRIKEDKEADLNDIDVSNITDMSYLFMKCEDFNGDISEWDVSNVKNMSNMFYECKKFNCDLSNWDVSNVTDMSFMFDGCENFNGDISTWNVSNVTNMCSMFHWCEIFNCDLSKWDVSKVTNMIDMFNNCKKFVDEGLYNWNVKPIKKRYGYKYSLEDMFYNCPIDKNPPKWYDKNEC